MKILLTGSHGFLGDFIRQKLANYSIFTLSRNSKVDFKCDLSVSVPEINGQSFDLIIHNAGKAHSMPKTLLEEEEFFKVNFDGTRNLCYGLENTELIPQKFVFISTVAVYGLETGENIREDTPLLGTSPYAISKIKAEFFLIDWCKKHNVVLTILRLPLVVGPSAPGNFGAMLNAIKKGFYFRIGNGSAKRSMVLASDVAEIIMQASETGGVYNLTDGENPSFKELDAYLGKVFDKKIKVMPSYLAKIFATIGDYIPKFPFNSHKLSKMESSLTFSSELAKQKLNWNPKPVINNIF